MQGNTDLAMQAEQRALLNTSTQQSNIQDDEIDLAELWRAIWQGKILIIAISGVFALASVLFALSQPNVYKASTLLTPADGKSAGGLAQLAGSFGGLASMAGINLGSTGTDNTKIAIEILQSRSFIEGFIEKNDLLVPLMAVENYDLVNDKLIFNGDVYDVKSNTWLRKVKPPKAAKPSSWEAYQAFSELLSVSQDKASSLVTIELKYFSPKLAQQWLVLLVEEINLVMREQAYFEAQESIDYLNQQLDKINIASMETVFYQLIEEQSKNMMLTQVKKEYALKTLDPAQVPDIKDGPKRALIVVLGTMLGGMLSVFIVLVRYFLRSNRESLKDKG